MNFPLIGSQLASRRWRKPPREVLGYGDPAGYRPLRETIAAHLHSTRAVQCDADQVIIVAGTQQALDFGSVLLQFFILGLILALLDILYESMLALVAGTFSGWITRSPTFTAWRQRVTGAVLVGLGVRLALAQRE